ncbi:uncharacterized protein DDB_G0284459-like [Trichogramma pretiosum]|uniref:uncharacterized protein DDB_G0284459-like n=1 Tax=Trichogramma pretiosum TaxID=7493 RepID=UPI0006C9BFF0|nr:uncharacterized protein DDB_G0284459-like [Trichogramma pretiosum]XP_014236443.1 uncharacterized protein DDB_G0284459-like [Trichogramma pretiosum]XP_014236444.1 uncharacterized protein DDB_G0284459-like [Trichogramma pretiosum]
MNLHTLLLAADYIEKLEKNNLKQNSSSANVNNDQRSNDRNSATEPRGNKLKRERADKDQDDLLCQEKLFIIEGEEPIDGQARQNGVYYHQPVHNVHAQQQHQLTQNVGGRNANINQPRIIVGSPISTVATVHGREIHSDVIQLQQQQPQTVQQQHQQSSSAQFNPHLENNNSNHSVSSASGLAPAPGTEVDQQASTSQTSTGSEHRRTRNGSVSSSRSGTREVHNKLEKNRRAHLKECFETLKKQLPPSDDKKASNLAILHQSLKHIQSLKKKEREHEHEMERLARDKITGQQRLAVLKRELSLRHENIDFNAILPTEPDEEFQRAAAAAAANPQNQEAEGGNSNSGLARAGTRYSSTSSLSSAATDNSHSAQQQQQQQQQQPSNDNANGSSSQMAATAVVFSQTQNVNLGQGIRESPPTISSPNATTATQPTPAQEKVTIATSVVQAQTVAASQITSATPTQLHLPISAQMINASSSLAFVPALQQIGSSFKVIPSDGRQLIAVQSNGPNSGVSGTTGEPRSVALVVHSTTANNDNRVTLVHSTSNDVRPVTFVSGSMLTAAHAPISVTNAQTKLRPADGAQTHKVVCADLSLVQNGLFRSVKTQPLTVQGGITLSHAVSKTSNALSQASATVATAQSNLSQNSQPIPGITPLVAAPMTVVSQGGGPGQQVIALASTSLPGKVISAPLHTLKPINQNQFNNYGYKPVVVLNQQQPQNNTNGTVTSKSGPTTSTSSQHKPV